MKTKLFFISLFFSAITSAQTIALEVFSEGFTNLTEIIHAGDNRLFAVQQNGIIKIVAADGITGTTPFLNIGTLISNGNERGLLGLAFHPEYAANGYFYVNYTNTAGNTVIARYTRDTNNPAIANPASALVLMTINQPAANHNGGCIRFGQDGYLYISVGDGGGAGDPNGNAQNKNTLLGKLLRIDVNSGTTYTSPATNPFIGIDGADEIWAVGLRNAWKFSFNRLNGDLWIADVGQDNIEEINKVTVTIPAPNFGWKCFEGTAVYSNENCSLVEMYTFPFAEYRHDATGGCSITGGYVYTGANYPALRGKYLFADYCNDKIGIVADNGSITYTPAFDNNGFTVFGQDINGELYIGGKQSGKIYKIVDSTMGIKDLGNSSFAIYPNPASGIVNIKNASGSSYAAKVAVYDLSGKLLLNKALENTAVNTIATDNIPAGLYMMNIVDSNGTSYNYKLAVE